MAMAMGMERVSKHVQVSTMDHGRITEDFSGYCARRNAGIDGAL